MGFIKDFYPLKALFLKDEPISLRIELQNPTTRPVELKAVLQIMHLEDTVSSQTLAISLSALQTKNADLSLPLQAYVTGGFGAELTLYISEEETETASTAFDRTDCPKKIPRYGFLCGFRPDEPLDDSDVKSLLKYHINLVQFYDWVYRHDDYLSDQKIYRDMMGKTISLDVLRQKIAACHQHGMRAIAYGAIYAASGGYFEQHPEQALYTGTGEPIRFIDVFYIMNASRESGWHDHIIGEYEKAISVLDFDGIHMDTYGFPKSGLSRKDGTLKESDLRDVLPELIQDTRMQLAKKKPDCRLIFNNVCNWPVEATARAEVDVVYIEVWEPYERYTHLQQLIAWAKLFGQGKPVVLAAYLKPFMETGNEQEAENAALLLTASIAANGAYHLLLGEENGVLTQGYYPDHSILRAAFADRMRSYYDFIVRYSGLLFDDSLCDVSMTHMGGDNREYRFMTDGDRIVPYAQSDTVWAVIKQNKSRRIVHFINLTNNGEDYWNKGKKTPAVQQNIRICAEILNEPTKVYAISPDFEHCRPLTLDFTVKSDDHGKYVEAALPALNFWTAIIMQF